MASDEAEIEGIWTNCNRAAFERLCNRHSDHIATKKLAEGLPATWRGPIPAKGTKIFPRREGIAYVSPGPGYTHALNSNNTPQPANETREYYRDNFDSKLLPVSDPPINSYTFLPLRRSRSGANFRELQNKNHSEGSPQKKRCVTGEPKSLGGEEFVTTSDTRIPRIPRMFLPYKVLNTLHQALIPTTNYPSSSSQNRGDPFGITSYRSDKLGNSNMVGKKSGRALQLEEGLERTDNGMKQTSWPEVGMINQKNYYTEYMKRDDQILPLRLQAEANRERMIRTAKDRDRALARTGNTDVPGPIPDDVDFGVDDGAADSSDGLDASKIIVIHPGSQYMRIGFASDALPKTVPMVTGMKWSRTESDQYMPRPKREDFEAAPEHQFGEEFAKKYTKQCNDLKIDMRANKRKVLPNSKELVINYNRRTPPETIPEHNDPVRIEWTDPSKDTIFSGLAAQRIPDNSDPKFKLFWPLQHGWLNERDYPSKEFISDTLTYSFEEALRKELSLDSFQLWRQYSCVFVIPDLYDKTYVEELLRIGLIDLEFAKVCFIQESLAASFGAGYSTACIVDVGAQKTSICCVEDGMCIDDSRINLKYGGYDVTETFIKMMLYDHFPYQEINLMQRYDFLLAEELKIKFCTLNQADISVQLYNFHLRIPSDDTRKYQFKTYDEVILAPMGFYDPSIFDNSDKLDGRRQWIDRSYNAYDPDMPDDPVSAAQVAILTSIKPSLGINTLASNGEVSTPAKEKSQPFNLLSRIDSDMLGNNGTPGTSTAGSPAPEGANTPNPAPFAFGTNGHGNGGSPGPSNVFQFGNGSPAPPSNLFTKSPKEIANERDSVLPIAPLDTAIITSIQHAAKGDDKKFRDLIGGIMVIGGGAKTPGFGPFLEERLKTKRPDLAEKILVGTSPREMDGQVVVWKGASVFGKLVNTNDSWISGLEYERLNSRVLYHKVPWNY